MKSMSEEFRTKGAWEHRRKVRTARATEDIRHRCHVNMESGQCG